MRCDRYRRQVRAVARGEAAAGRRVESHVRGCLRCQAEMARERRLQRRLRSMRQEPIVPRGLVERVLATIETARLEPQPRSGARTTGIVASAGAIAGVLAVGLGTRVGRRALGLAS